MARRRFTHTAFSVSCGRKYLQSFFLKQIIRFASSKPVAIWNFKLPILSDSQSLANSVQPFPFAQASQAKSSSFAYPLFR